MISEHRIPLYPLVNQWLPTKSCRLGICRQTDRQTRPDQTRPDQTRPDQTRPDQTRPDRQTDTHTHILYIYMYLFTYCLFIEMGNHMMNSILQTHPKYVGPPTKNRSATKSCFLSWCIECYGNGLCKHGISWYCLYSILREIHILYQKSIYCIQVMLEAD